MTDNIYTLLVCAHLQGLVWQMTLWNLLFLLVSLSCALGCCCEVKQFKKVKTKNVINIFTRILEIKTFKLSVTFQNKESSLWNTEILKKPQNTRILVVWEWVGALQGYSTPGLHCSGCINYAYSECVVQEFTHSQQKNVSGLLPGGDINLFGSVPGTALGL